MPLSKQKSQGFTLIEILITVLILAIGLLGLAGLQTSGLRYSQSSYHRTQAALLAYDILDRMRVNRDVALGTTAYNLDLEDVTPNNPNCSPTCPATLMAAVDLAEWRSLLANTLPGGNGSVIRAAGQELYAITIEWNDVRGEDIQKQIDQGNAVQPRLSFIFEAEL